MASSGDRPGMAPPCYSLRPAPPAEARDLARDAAGAVAADLPPGAALELAVPLGPLDPAAMAATIEGLGVDRTVRTPLAAAITAVAADLRR